MSTFMQALQDFHFLRPWWLLGMVPAAALVILLWKRKASYGSWDQVISPHLLPHLMQGGQTHQNRIPLILLLAGWLLASIAMAGPTWQQLPQAVQKKIDAQVIVLDLSLSMYATDLPPSRLTRARMKLTDILQRSNEGLTALVVFAGTAHVVTPLTDDSNTILSMVNSLSPDIMPIRGSDPVAAVRRALDVLKQGGVEEGRILLMTDDIPADFVGELSPHLSRATPLSIMGIGTQEGAPIPLPDGSFVKGTDGQIVVPRLHLDNLKQAARQLGGRFSTLSASDDDLNYLLADTRLMGGNELKDTRRQFDVWDEAGPWLVALLLLPLAALGYRRGWLGAMLPPLLLGTGLLGLPQPAAAFDWIDLWKTPDQQGQQLLQQGDHKAAAETFEHPGWKGTSHYRDGNFAAAADAFAHQQDADSQYNLGNALARQQKFEEAIATYENVLKDNPDHADAQFNLDLLKQLMEQQQQQDQSSSSDQNQQQDQDQQQEQNEQQEQEQNEQEQEQNQQDQNEPEQNQQNQDQQQEQNEEQNQEPPAPEEQQQEQAPAEREQPPARPQPQDQEQSEDQQALEQWLRRIPDDPGGLLRRKFQKETQLHKAPTNGDSTW